MKKQDILQPDLNRKLYTIVIDVYPNVNVFRLESIEDGLGVHVQHIVGALEVVKNAYLRDDVTPRSRAAFKKKLASEKKKP